MPTTSTRRTKRFGLAAAALAVAGLGTACALPSAGPAAGGCQGPGGPPSATTSAVFNLTNASRAAVGVGGVSWNPQLWCLASEWSAEMGRTGSMHHRDLNATIRDPAFAGYRTLGENVLYGPATMSGDEMHNAWMNSPGHRANILSSAFTSFAVATAYPQGPGGQVWATENFGG